MGLIIAKDIFEVVKYHQHRKQSCFYEASAKIPRPYRRNAALMKKKTVLSKRQRLKFITACSSAAKPSLFRNALTPDGVCPANKIFERTILTVRRGYIESAFLHQCKALFLRCDVEKLREKLNIQPLKIGTNAHKIFKVCQRPPIPTKKEFKLYSHIIEKSVDYELSFKEKIREFLIKNHRAFYDKYEGKAWLSYTIYPLKSKVKFLGLNAVSDRIRTMLRIPLEFDKFKTTRYNSDTTQRTLVLPRVVRYFLGCLYCNRLPIYPTNICKRCLDTLKYPIKFWAGLDEMSKYKKNLPKSIAEKLEELATRSSDLGELEDEISLCQSLLMNLLQQLNAIGDKAFAHPDIIDKLTHISNRIAKMIEMRDKLAARREGTFTFSQVIKLLFGTVAYCVANHDLFSRKTDPHTLLLEIIPFLKWPLPVRVTETGELTMDQNKGKMLLPKAAAAAEGKDIVVEANFKLLNAIESDMQEDHT
ncbi:MAG: hypothetical protein KatS3mg087_1293 [Patescibacteria group bacterium]|nr:MAG: hypothetical protein KatS3mg087_1293 [Patescibacteria group bacterium]